MRQFGKQETAFSIFIDFLKLLGGYAFFFLIAGVLIASFVFTGFQLRAEAVCLDHGFPDARVNFKFQSFCSRVDHDADGNVQSLVVPLNQLQSD